MGRIARAATMRIVRGFLTRGGVFVYVVGVCFAFFFIPLGRWSDGSNPDPADLAVPLGLGTFFLVVGPALVAVFATRWRNARLDSVFTPLGLAGFPFALQYRRYDGTFSGRRLQAFVSYGPRIVLEADTSVPTRFGITADAEDTRLLAALTGATPIRLAVPAFDGLVVFGKEEPWVRRLLAEPGVPALLSRLLRDDGPLARRQVVLRPGALTLTFQFSTALLSWIPTPRQTADWAGALADLAAIAERIPAPAQPLAQTRLEAQADALRGMGPRVNPGVVALVAVLVTPLLIGAAVGLTILSKRACPPERGPGSRVEGFEVLGNVHLAARTVQVSDLKAVDLLGSLGTVEHEDDDSLRAAAKVPRGARIVVTKDPVTRAGREVEWTFETPPAIRMRDLEERWGTPSVATAPDDPGAAVAYFTMKADEGSRWPVRVRVRFEGKAGGPVTRIAAVREPERERPPALPETAAGAAPVTAATSRAGPELLSPCPTSFEMAGEMAVGDSRSCVCVHGSIGGTVFGSGRYGPATWICEAARHAGVLQKRGDTVTFFRQPACPRLWGSEGNGVVSVNRGAPAATFSFTEAPPPCPPPPDSSLDLQPCPVTASVVESMSEGSSFDCTCTYRKNPGGVAWGKDVYTIFSSVCDAAQHAGAVERPASTVTVFVGGPCARFVRSRRMGIDSDSWSKTARSLAFRLPYPPCPDSPDTR